MHKHFKKVLWVLLGVAVFAAFNATYFYLQFKSAKEFVWGINFSQTQATYLGLDWKQAYVAILNDLKPERLRLVSFWEILEPERGQYSFTDLDFQILKAQEYQIPVVLVLGRKQPRWPECHQPDWFGGLTVEEQQKAQLEFVARVVQRYRTNPAILAWQVENEPRFAFGPECPTTPLSFLRKEVALVKNLDSRPVVVTDSGELGFWLPAAWSGADWFGSTMYRTVFHKRFGYITYWFTPAWYRIKAGMLQTFTPITQILGVELQAEPWFDTDVFQTPLQVQTALMNPSVFATNVAYAKQVGFKENYLWGAEWWYWLKVQQGDGSMWDAAREAIANP